MAKVFLISLFDEYALGLRYIASSLLRENHEVQLTFLKLFHELSELEPSFQDDAFIEETPFPVLKSELDLLIDEVENFGPDLIGISLVSNLFGLATVISKRLRQRQDIPIMWGGVEPTVNPDLAQQYSDIVCVGEGEKAITELLNKMSICKDREGLETIAEPIDNLRISQKKGWLIPVHEGIMIKNIDTLPFPLFDVNHEVYVTNDNVFRGVRPSKCRLHSTFPIISARGCPFQCSYCANSILRKRYSGGKYLRRRSPDNVIEELKHRKSQFPNIQVLEIEDDVFTLNKEWIDEFASAYKKEINIPFWCYTFPGLADEAILEQLKTIGLLSVTFGIQSGSERVLRDVYQRKTTQEKILETAHTLHKLNIPYVVDLIGSNPLENDIDRIETVRLLLSLPKPFLIHPINPITFYEYYPITQLAKEQEITLLKTRGTTKYGPEHDSRFDAWNAILTLAQFPHIDESILGMFWNNENLMQNPEPIEQLVNALAEATYYQNNIYETKDVHIQKIEEELATLNGSRLVRIGIDLRNLINKMR